jgi:hypothetical protein
MMSFPGETVGGKVTTMGQRSVMKKRSLMKDMVEDWSAV